LITYNKLELLKPGHNNELLKDLSRHTGQNIEKVTIKKINTRKSNAEIEVYFNNTKTT
jgi:uncharacterized FAD-dependent dehydrogenase